MQYDGLLSSFRLVKKIYRLHHETSCLEVSENRSSKPNGKNKWKGWGGVGRAIIRGVDEYKGKRVWKTETARHQIII